MKNIYKIIDRITILKTNLKSNSAISYLIKAQNDLYEAIKEEEALKIIDKKLKGGLK